VLLLVDAVLAVLDIIIQFLLVAELSELKTSEIFENV